MSDLTAVFSDICAKHKWGGGAETVSGSGSTVRGTTQLRTDLAALLKKLDVHVFVDAPCGDFNWMRLVDLDGIHYIGADIVPDLVAKTAALYGNAERQFITADIAKDILPRADLILCRDCLVHLPFAVIKDVLANLKSSGSKYLLATTFPGVQNKDIRAGDWRVLDLTAAPFNLPPPVEYMPDAYELGGFPNKRLGLWDLALT